MRLLFVLLFSVLLFARDDVNIDDIKDWVDAGQYNRICSDSVRDLFVREQNFSIANIYAKACLKVDKINDLIIPIVMLYNDKESRENSAIYSTILFQKKMLYFSLVDGYDISYIKTPKIDYILSFIFDKYVLKDYEKIDNKYIFKINNDTKCNVYVKKEQNLDKMVFEIYKLDKLVSTKIYW